MVQEGANSDFKVNNLDTNWANLKVWCDLNQDGVSQQEDELFTMAQAGIAEFNVARIFNNQILPDGNQIADMDTYTRQNKQSLRIEVLAPTIWAGPARHGIIITHRRHDRRNGQMQEFYGRCEFKDFIARRNFLNTRRMYVFWGVQLLLALMFLTMAVPVSAGKGPAKLMFEISNAAVEIQIKYGMPVAYDREKPWYAFDYRPGHYSIIFYRSDEIPQGVVLDTVKLCMDLYQKQGLKERLESIEIIMYRESKEEWRKSLFLGIGSLTTVKPFFKLTIGRR